MKSTPYLRPYLGVDGSVRGNKTKVDDMHNIVEGIKLATSRRKSKPAREIMNFLKTGRVRARHSDFVRPLLLFLCFYRNGVFLKKVCTKQSYDK